MARRGRTRTGSGQKLQAAGAEVVGVKELVEVFEKLPAAMQKSVVKDGLDDGGQVVLHELARHVPIGTRAFAGHEPGTLLRSLHVGKVRSSKKYSRVFVGSTKEGFYGGWIEYGTQHMPARPWMRPALDAAFQRTVAEFRESVREGLDDTVADLARQEGTIR